MAIPNPPVSNPNINTTFTVAMQFIETGNNFRRTPFQGSLGLPVINNSNVTTLSIAASGTEIVFAFQLVALMSDQPLVVTISPDQTTLVSSPGSSIQVGNTFVLTGSYTTNGITLFNPNSTVATVKVATVS
jgi:hypothetical protein